MKFKDVILIVGIGCVGLLISLEGKTQVPPKAYSLADTIYGNTLIKLADSLYYARRYEEAIQKTILAKEVYSEIYEPNHPLVIDCWDQIGFIYYKNNEYQKAIDNQLIALDLYREKFKNHSKIGVLLSNIGAFYSNIGEFRLSLKFHKESVAYKEKHQRNNIKSLSISYGNIATTYQELTEVDSSITYHKKSLSLRKKAFGEESYQVAYTLNALGSSYQQLGKFHEQIDYTLKALRLFEQTVKETHPEKIRCYNNLGFAYKGLGDFKNAIRYHEKYLELSKKIDNSTSIQLSIAYNNLAVDYIEAGKYIRAKHLAEQALLNIPKQYPEDYYIKGKFYNTLGRCYSEIGDIERAINFFEKSLFIRVKHAEENQTDLSYPYHNLAMSYNQYGNQEKAIEYFQKAIENHLSKLEEFHPNTAIFYEGLGLTYLELKNFEKASLYLQKSYTIKTELLGSNHINSSYTLHKLADIQYAQENYTEAANLYQKAIEIKIKKFGDIHPQIGISLIALAKCNHRNNLKKETIDNYQTALIAFNYLEENHFTSVNQIDGLIYALDFIGSFHKDEFIENNEIQNLYKSQNYYKQAIKAIHYKSSFISSESKDNLVKIAKPIYEKAIQVNYLISKNEKTTFEQIEYLLDLAEQSKATILLGAIRKNNALFLSKIPDSLLEKNQDIKLQIADLSKLRQLKIKDLGITDDTTILKISNKLADLLLKKEETEKILKDSYPIYASATTKQAPISLKKIQRKLTDNQTLIEYVTGESFSYIFLINSDTTIIREIKMDFSLSEWISKFQKGLIKYHTSKGLPSSMLSTLTEQYVLFANKLYQKFINPIAPHLKEEILIIPDGSLGYIPFELLLKKQPINLVAFHNYPYLIKSHTINYSYSISLYEKMKQLKHSKPLKRALAIAPFYQGNFSKIVEKIDSMEIITFRRDTIESLPYSGEEIALVSKVTNGEKWFGKEATMDRFIREAGNYQLIHLSTHGVTNDKYQEDAYLAFCNAENNNKFEKLFINDIYNLSLNADLVVLSACETGIGELQKGEGIISLARAFAYAGAKSIVTTQWNVDDKRTSQIMQEFYQQLAIKKPKDEALRQAKLKFIQKNKSLKAHPFFWGGIFSVGDNAPIQN